MKTPDPGTLGVFIASGASWAAGPDPHPSTYTHTHFRAMGETAVVVVPGDRKWGESLTVMELESSWVGCQAYVPDKAAWDGVTEHLSASCPLFPQGGGLWPCLGPIPLAFILTLLLRVIPLALSAFLGGRVGRDAARLERGAAGRSWSHRLALEKWLLLCRGFG